MTRKLHSIIVIIVFLGVLGSTSGQLLPSLDIAGGMTAGWHFNPVKDLNAELKKAGFPVMSEDGFFTLGGGGFIDLPLKGNFLRIGGFGNGYTSKKENKVNDTLTKAANYSLGHGGISIDFVKPIGTIVDLSIGAQFSTGVLKLELYQYGKDFGNYSTIFGELSSNGSSSNLSRVFKSRFYSVQPQIGIGLLLKKFLYIKIDCGYQFGAQNTWRVDNDVEVKSFPSGIQPKGLVLNLGLNFGLFIRD